MMAWYKATFRTDFEVQAETVLEAIDKITDQVVMEPKLFLRDVEICDKEKK